MLDHESHLQLTEDDDVAAASRERAARTVLGLTRLLAARPELRGVHAPADFAADAVRWSA